MMEKSRPFQNEVGSDNLKETIEANYRKVKQEILPLVDSEIQRIKNTPALSHLISDKQRKLESDSVDGGIMVYRAELYPQVDLMIAVSINKLRLYQIVFVLLLSAKHSDLKFDLLICRTADYIHVYPHVYRRKNCLLSRNQANWGTFQST